MINGRAFICCRFYKTGSVNEMALVVKSAVRERLKDMRASGDFFEALDKHVAEELTRAVARAKANGRKTLRPEDL